MNEYKELLDQLNSILTKINGYEKEIKELQTFIGEKTNSSNELLSKQYERIEDFKLKINEYIELYSETFLSFTKLFKNELDKASNENIEKVRSELDSEIDKILNSMNESFLDVYGKLNQSRLELVEQLEKSVEFSKLEEKNVKQLNIQIETQNEYLKTINDESKRYINQYFDEIKSLKDELDLLKENFELKYVLNRKRVFTTSISMLFIITMLIITTMSSYYMFSYFFQYIFFPSRIAALFYGIMLAILGIGLFTVLVLIIVRPPTFIKIKRNKQ